MTDLSIIIVNYNGLQLVLDCLASIREHVRSCSYEIIVVDNASSDGSRDALSRESWVTYIYLEENVGFGRANNRGIEVARGRNILFLNPDTILKNDAPSMLSHYLDAHPRVGACGGNLFTVSGTPNQSFMRYRPSVRGELHMLTWNLWYKLRGDRNITFNYGDKPLQVGYIIGADLCVRKTVLDEVGVFDKDFFLYYEETDLCHRIEGKGYELHSVPQAQIVHFEGGSVASESKVKNMRKSRQIFLWKHYSTPHRWFINGLHAAWKLGHKLHHPFDVNTNP